MIDSDICEIIAVRHGQTVANKTGILQGQLNTPLDATGLRQAQAIAERLKSRHFDVVISSDLERAMDTARAILKYHPGIELIKSPALREWNLGRLQGREYKELIVEYPDIMNAFKKEMPDTEIPDGESMADFQQRISSFLDKTAAENCGKRVLLVSHGGAMQRMLAHTFGRLNNVNIRPLCANASLSVFQHKSGGWQLVTWNDTAHLENIEIHDTLTF